MNFKDHFSGHSADYSQFRPTYPDDLFAWLAGSCARHELAWDCATGSGQAAVSLARHFAAVIGTDASANQIAEAVVADNVSYRVAKAEASGLDRESIDLVTVAQALHWFDLPAFAAEVARVLRPDGVIAVWTYGLLSFGNGLDPLIARFYGDIVGDYWPFERQLVESGYASVEMPELTEIDAPDMRMAATWDFSHLLGYLNTWSAVKAYDKAHDLNPVQLVHDELLQEWGDPAAVREARWPLMIRAWRKPAA